MASKEPRTPGHPLGDWREHAATVGKAAMFKLLTFQVLPFLVLGAVMLGSAIAFWQEMRGYGNMVATLTEPAEAVVEGTWWRLDMDGERLARGDISNWPGVTSPSLCVQFRVEAASGNRPGAACLRYGRILDFSQAASQLANLSEGSGFGAAVPWRGADGGLEVGLHVPAEAFAWLTENRSPYAFFSKPWTPQDGHGEEGDLSYWDLFLRDFDQPDDYLITAWQLPARIPVRFDPERPERVVPATFIEDRYQSDLTFMVPVLAVFGAVFWGVGLSMLMLGSKRRTRMLVVVLTLAVSPWWGQWVWRGLDFMLADATEIGRFLETVLLPRPPVVEFMPPDYAGEPGDERYTWSFETSSYAPLLRGLDFSMPSEPLSEADARSRADNLIQQAMLAATPEARQKRFVLLACYAGEGLREAGYLFLEVGRYWTHDEAAGRAATTFVEYQQDSGIRFHSLPCAAALERDLATLPLGADARHHEHQHPDESPRPASGPARQARAA